jgi:hypothetical protein
MLTDINCVPFGCFILEGRVSWEKPEATPKLLDGSSPSTSVLSVMKLWKAVGIAAHVVLRLWEKP